MTLIGYVLSGQDNGTFMFDDDDPALPRCGLCGYKLDFQATNPQYRLGRKGRGWDVGGTFDGQLVVSRRFRDFCVANRIAGINFNSFANEPDFFHAVSNRVLGLDPVKSMLRLSKQCGRCGNFESVVGPYRRFKVDGSLLPGFYRSDLALASGNEKGYVLVMTPDVRRALEGAGMKGLAFSLTEDASQV